MWVSVCADGVDELDVGRGDAADEVRCGVR